VITSFVPIVPWLGSLCGGYAKTTTSSTNNKNKKTLSRINSLFLI